MRLITQQYISQNSEEDQNLLLSSNQKKQSNSEDLQQSGQENLSNIKQLSNKKRQILLEKLRNISQQDKYDIFQFLFLDMCIQIYQQSCHDNRIMESINRQNQKMKELKKRPKGIKTNINVIRDYLKRFCGYFLRTNKQALKNLNVPMGPTALQMLRYMHDNDFIQQNPTNDQQMVALIAPIMVFDAFEKSLLPNLEFQRYFESQEKQNQRIKFLKSILHIHNKALFDCLNQFLDRQRSFGIWGKPFPWKKTSNFQHIFNDEQIQNKLKKSADKVVDICKYVCGLLLDKQQSLVTNIKVSETYLDQIRQDRVSRMLANDMIQNQEKWVFYDDQQTEVLVETTATIFSFLLTEFSYQLYLLRIQKENQ